MGPEAAPKADADAAAWYYYHYGYYPYHYGYHYPYYGHYWYGKRSAEEPEELRTLPILFIWISLPLLLVRTKIKNLGKFFQTAIFFLFLNNGNNEKFKQLWTSHRISTTKFKICSRCFLGRNWINKFRKKI